MGNCTSKKSDKLLKATTNKKPIFLKMEKEVEFNNPKGLSKKIAPFTKGEVTSFGFKRKPNSLLPVPVTLTSNENLPAEKRHQNGVLKTKDIIEDSHSGSSIESLCHNAPLRSTPKMIRKKDDGRQSVISTAGNTNNNNPCQNNENITRSLVNSNVRHNSSHNNSNNNRVSFHRTNASTNVIGQNNNMNNNHNMNNNNNNGSTAPPNRFGFRQPVRFSDPPKLEKHSTTSERRIISNLGPYDTGTQRVKKGETGRSRSEGLREAFFKQTIQPAGSMQSVLGQSGSNISCIPPPGKFTLQTSHLPRPQYAVRMADTKTVKTVTNYYRRGGPQSDSSSSKEGSINDDSGFETQSKPDESFESPGLNVRRRLQSAHGKKLEMKIVGNKFELLDKAEEKDRNVVTEVSLIKLPMSGIKATTAVINTGLVEQRTNQYLKRISEFNKKDFSVKQKESGICRSNTRLQDSSSDSSHVDEGFGAESEEEKLFKDRNRSEKSAVNYLINDECGDDAMLPGEAMAEDVSLSFSSDDETSAIALRPKRDPGPAVNLESEITPNTIRLDALKLSKQLKSGNAFMVETGSAKTRLKIDDGSSIEIATSCDPDDETFPSESILEQLSSYSDSFGDKGENKNNDKEKNLKAFDDDLEIEELDDDRQEIDLKNVDLDVSDTELNIDEKELVDNPNNPADPRTPESPGTPTNASNSFSLSEGRDFLIDDEIADQPQLCLTETYPDCSCQEDAKTCNDKTLTSSGNNVDFVSCAEGGNTQYKNESTQAVSDDEDEIVNIEANSLVNGFSPTKREKRLNSAGTLSPCESLTSDDLMMDFESSACDEASERMGISGRLSQSDITKSRNVEDTLKESRVVSSQKNTCGTGGGLLLKSRPGNSTPGSPRPCEAVANCTASSPRLMRPSEDDSISIDKASYEHMFQDIAGIKKMLLKLRQVLSESEGENGVRAASDELDEMSDLRRQVTFLQQELEDRERTVQTLQMEISKTCNGVKSNGTSEAGERCNAATQTDRVRPVSTGPSLLQNLSSDSGNVVSNHFTNSKTLRSYSRSRTELIHDERNTRGFVAVKKSPHVEKIMEKVKELSFKPVEVLEREESLRSRDGTRTKGLSDDCNGIMNGYGAENGVKQPRNVFKITKIDLVLKSDNYGKTHLSQSNR